MVATKEMNGEKQEKAQIITITANGPYIVSGKVPLNKESIIDDEKGVPVEWKRGKSYPEQETYALCRCGGSNNKPYCDGTHTKIGFKGTETASRERYTDTAKRYHGPALDLMDRLDYCSGLRFCHRNNGVWGLVNRSRDPKTGEIIKEVAADCASGRLVACDNKTSEMIEPKLEKSIAIVEEPARGVSGPLWIKGEIPIVSADGSEYEVRNRVTLCRCGGSKNKPFCDGMHSKIGFKDEDEII